MIISPSHKRQSNTLAHATLLAAAILIGGCEDTRSPAHSLEVDFRGLQSGALSADGEQALVGSILHGGSFWRTATGERLYRWNHAPGEQSTLLTAAISVNGQWAATTDLANLVLWNTATGAAERFWTAPGVITATDLDKDAERAILALANERAVVFHIKRGGILHSLHHSARVNSVAISADGLYALTGSSDYSARYWDLTSGEPISTMTHGDDVQLVALSPDGSLALSVSKYDKAWLWHPQTGDLRGEVPLAAERLKRGLSFSTARFSNDNQRLLVGRPDGVVQLWNTDPMRKMAQWRLPKRHKWQPTGAVVMDVAFAADGNFYALASNGFVHSLTMETGAAPAD